MESSLRAPAQAIYSAESPEGERAGQGPGQGGTMDLTSDCLGTVLPMLVLVVPEMSPDAFDTPFGLWLSVVLI